MMGTDLPSGTVTFLFTDVEGSTRLLHELGPEAYGAALAEHRRIVRAAIAAHGGVEVDTQGDAFFVAFPTAPGALAAVSAIRDALASGPIRVRMGIHTGTPHLTAEGYVGADVHRAARIAAAGHGGQVLVSAATVALVGTAGLRDLGEHRLKDLSAPERIYQLGEDQFPPLKSLHQTNLPFPATPFLGREQELAEVGALLARDDVRLLTLTGPGGTGKTRLALQAAGMLAERYPEGVWWVPLATLRDAALVLATASQALGAQEDLVDHIGDKSLLLLFDNFEQVVAAAPEVAALLSSCPGLELLVTSRQPLHVGAEQEYPVPPLVHEEGIDFFLARARAVLPDFQADAAVSEICRRLDDLPLAIELAAARVKALTTGQILERLDRSLPILTSGARDLPERQRTLRATIEWSHALLTADEQGLFARLALFRGGCTLEAAEQVADAALDTLQSLLDKSLLRHVGERFWMLETIHEYAAERLYERADQATLHDRHLAYFLALAERAYEERSAAESTWSPIVGIEHDNVRAALDWASISHSPAEAQLAAAVAPYWFLQGHVREARERLTAALSRYDVVDQIRARALTQLGRIDRDAPETLAQLDEALALWRGARDPLGEASTLEAIGHVHLYAGEYPAARRAYEQSLAVLREARAPELEETGALAGLCQLLVAAGEIERVEPMAHQLYELGARYGNRDTQGDGLHYLADCPLIAGDYGEAEKRYRLALAHARKSSFAGQCATELIGVAMSAAGQGDHERAVRLAAAAYAQRQALGLTPGNPAHWWMRLQAHHIGGARSHLTQEDVEEAERAGRDAPFDAVLDEVLGPGSAPAVS